MDPIDRAAAATESRGSSRRAERGAARAESRARRRAEKQARKEAKRTAHDATEDEALAEPVATGDSDVEQTAVDEVPIAALTSEPVESDEPAADLTDDTRGADDADGGQRLAVADALVARLPAINPAVAAIITGALSGLAAVGLALGAAKGCEAVRDTESCGGGLGLLAIVAILAIEVVIGANLLKAWQISDPFSTSFLGVGLVATLAMLLFLDDLDSVWMLLVIPLMTAVAFALSWWVTVRFIDEHEMASEVDSERGEPAVEEKSADEDANA